MIPLCGEPIPQPTYYERQGARRVWETWGTDWPSEAYDVPDDAREELLDLIARALAQTRAYGNREVHR